MISVCENRSASMTIMDEAMLFIQLAGVMAMIETPSAHNAPIWKGGWHEQVR